MVSELLGVISGQLSSLEKGFKLNLGDLGWKVEGS